MADIRTMNKPVVALGRDLMGSLFDLPKKAQKHATTFLTNSRRIPDHQESIWNESPMRRTKNCIPRASTNGIAPSSLSRKAAMCTSCCTLATTMTPTNGRKQRNSTSTRTRGPSSCTIWFLKRKSTRQCVKIPRAKLGGRALPQTCPTEFHYTGIRFSSHGRP